MGYEFLGKSPAQFSIAKRLLELDPKPGNLVPPLTEAPGLKITDWRDRDSPQLNGTPLKLKPYAGPPSGYRTGRQLRARHRVESPPLRPEGKERWGIPVPGVAWSVNVAKNGKVVVAALGDGTLRWYRLTDGKELLAFFPHADKKRWVLWTPSGYYDASPGGEDLIGWHVNHGRDQAADFFPASRFRDAYYRPDVVAKVLQTGDESEAVKLANAEAGGRKAPAIDVTRILPPVVRIVSPAAGATTARMKLR